jgi:dihydrofolate synthase/folylpolyglutamate synthase
VEDRLDAAVDELFRSLIRAAPHVDWSLGDAGVRRPEYTRALLDGLGGPDRGMRFALVAGSKGKGSTSVLLASCLQACGWRVGLFSGPHSVDFLERIRVDGRAVPAEAFLRAAARLRPVRDTLEASLPPHRYISPVGQALAIAVLLFAEAGTDFNVIECGRGGAFDDTNVLEHELAVVTPVFEEHLDRLGPTLADVARHKAGICRDGTRSAVFARQLPDVEGILTDAARSRRIRVWREGEDFGAEAVEAGRGGPAPAAGQALRIRTPDGRVEEAVLPLLGAFQIQNAAVAAAAAVAAFGPLPPGALGLGLGRARWPGRCEVLQDAPLVLLDGAIHRTPARDVAALLAGLGRRPVAAVVGVPASKDYEGVYAALAPVADALFVTRAANPHLRFPADGEAAARRHHPLAREIPDCRAAVEAAMRAAGRDGAVAVVGTQSLVGEVLAMWGRDVRNLW